MRRHPRPGLTLTEVLVAMFVMALGLMALATLFPLGALQIGQALKDDRTAQTAMLADGWLRVYWRDAAAAYTTNPSALPAENALAGLDDPNVLTVVPSGSSTYTYTAPTAGAAMALLPSSAALNNTGSTATPTPGFVTSPYDTSLVGVQATSSSGDPSRTVRPNGRSLGQTASYPVLIDPLGWLSRSGTAAVGFERHWVGRAGAPGAGGAVYGFAPTATPLLLPRRNTAITGSLTAAYPAFALTDDLTYQPNGGSGQTTTDPSTGAATPQPLGRQGRYTWAALIQRPDNSLAHKATLKVLVFDGRPVGFAAAGDEVVLMNDPVPANNVQFHAGATAGSRSMSLLLPPRGPDQAPLLRRGGWVMLAVTEPATVTSPPTFPGNRPGVRKVSFHRVTGLTTDDELAAGQPSPLTGSPVVQYSGGPQMAVTPVAIDIDPPVPAEFITPAAGQPPLATQVILLAGLSEVFDRPDLDASN